MELMKRLGMSKQKPEPLPKKRRKPKRVPEEPKIKMPRGRLKKVPQDKGLVPLQGKLLMNAWVDF